MDKDKIIVSVVIDKQALVDRAFDISKNLSEFNEIKKVIDGKNQSHPSWVCGLKHFLKL